jgi:hypothetical protein
VVESKHDVADADQVAVLQQLGLLSHRNIIQERPVAAAHVLYVEAARSPGYLGMLPTDSPLLGQRNVAVGLSANQRFVAIEFVTPARLCTYFDYEISHATVSRFTGDQEAGGAQVFIPGECFSDKF